MKRKFVPQSGSATIQECSNMYSQCGITPPLFFAFRFFAFRLFRPWFLILLGFSSLDFRLGFSSLDFRLWFLFLRLSTLGSSTLGTLTVGATVPPALAIFPRRLGDRGTLTVNFLLSSPSRESDRSCIGNQSNLTTTRA